jgi:endonuclease/exonuclease/phosphatase family metal-dependent hydrolase
MRLGPVSHMELHEFWIDNLRKYETLEQLKASAFFADHGAQIVSYLETPQVIPFQNPVPRLSSFIRVVQWNIEKGKRFQPLLEQLQTHEILKWADVVILNEADRGMNRSENRDVTRELAEALEMHAVFGPAHFELTKGTDEELFLKGENRESLQGNAILSRYPISQACVIPLPISFEPYEFHEKRFGRRNCLWVRIQVKNSALWVGSVHLELRNTPRCRARQMAHILDNIPGGENEPCMLGGDLNTNSFARGTTWRSLNSVLRLLFNSPERQKLKLLHPEYGSEPLFRLLRHNGFDWERLNSSDETARAAIDSLEEAGFLPGPLLRLAQKRLEPYRGYLCFKLDWFIGKNVLPLDRGRREDAGTNVISRKPGVAAMENSGPGRISDHLPIYADIDLA